MTTRSRWIGYGIGLWAVLISLGPVAFGQTRDLLTLKDGSVIRGTILEVVPDSIVKIQTENGSLMVFKFVQVEKISLKEWTPPQPDAVETMPMTVPLSGQGRVKGTLSLLFGAAVPTGQFASVNEQNAGCAKAGLVFGAEFSYPLNPSLFWLTSVYYTTNPLNQNGYRQWTGLSSDFTVTADHITTLCPLTGLGMLLPASPELSLWGAAQIGYLASNYPAIKVYPAADPTLESGASASALALSLSGGIQTKRNFKITVKYLSAQTNYEFAIQGTPPALIVDRPTSFVLIYASIGL